MPPTTRGHDGTTGAFTSLGIFGATGLQVATTSGDALRTRSSINLDRAGQPRPTNSSRRVRTLFSCFQQTASSHQRSGADPRASRTAFLVSNPRTRMEQRLAADHWSARRWKRRSFSHYYAGVTSHHSMATRNLGLP